MHNIWPHFGGSVVLLGVAGSQSGPDRLVTAIAAGGLALTGIAQVLKQVLDFYRSRQSTVAAGPAPPPPVSR